MSTQIVNKGHHLILNSFCQMNYDILNGKREGGRMEIWDVFNERRENTGKTHIEEKK